MIWSPNLQIGLSFDKSSPEDDIGDAGITWSPRHGTTSTNTSGKFGYSYLFDGTSTTSNTNALSALNQTNPANITDEFTIACWGYWGSDISTFPYYIASFGNYTSSGSSNNVGIFCGIRPGNFRVTAYREHPFCTLRSLNSSALPGQSAGRNTWHATGVTVERFEWNFICFTRTSTIAYCYGYNDTNGWQVDSYGTYSYGNMSFQTNRHWYVGGYGNSSGNSTFRGNINDFEMDNFQCWNTALNESDVKRVMQGMHPLNS